MAPGSSDAAEITDLAVDRGARRCGAGRALVAQAGEWAASRGFRAVWVEPRSDNPDAIAFYLALGFRVTGFDPVAYSDVKGEGVVYMRLELLPKP